MQVLVQSLKNYRKRDIFLGTKCTGNTHFTSCAYQNALFWDLRLEIVSVL